MNVPIAFWTVTTFLFGIAIGSFLNVVIWRLPQPNGSLTDPAWSYCPNCKARLTAVDLVPLISFLALGGKCRHCKQPISWRYFRVELLTGVLFVILFLHCGVHLADAVALCLFAATLVPIYFIDFATFTIPDSLNLMAFVIAVARDGWGIALHEPGHALLWGWLPRSIFGALVGILIFGGVRVLGSLAYRREAMGLGDVLLARAMGAMLVSLTLPDANPVRLFPAWVLLACMSGAVVGPALIFIRRRASAGTTNETAGLESDEPDAPGPKLGSLLAELAWCLYLGDAIQYVRDIGRARRGEPAESVSPSEGMEDFVLAPTAIPFGPFMILGFFATILMGESLTAWYLAYALPPRGS